MRYAILEGDRLAHLVDVPDGWPSYVPPAGFTMREATPEDEAAGSLLPGYAPPRETGSPDDA